MGHLGNVADHAVAINALAQTNGAFGLGLGKLLRIQHIPQRYGSHIAVGHLNAHHGDFSGDSGDTNAGGTQAQRDIIGAAGQLIQANAFVQLHFVSGHTGAAGHIDDVRINIEASQGFIQAAGILPHFFGAVCTGTGRAFQQINGWETIIRLLSRFPLLNFFCDLLSRILDMLL